MFVRYSEIRAAFRPYIMTLMWTAQACGTHEKFMVAIYTIDSGTFFFFLQRLLSLSLSALSIRPLRCANFTRKCIKYNSDDSRELIQWHTDHKKMISFSFLLFEISKSLCSLSNPVLICISISAGGLFCEAHTKICAHRYAFR